MSEESTTPEPDSVSPQSPPPAPEPSAAPPPAPEASSSTPQAPADPSAYTKEQKDKKLIAGILGIVVGWLGVHKFYLGYTMEGVIMLAVGLVGLFICGFPTMAVGVIGLIEGILYLTKTDDEFVSTYVVGRKGWF